MNWGSGPVWLATNFSASPRTMLASWNAPVVPRARAARATATRRVDAGRLALVVGVVHLVDEVEGLAGAAGQRAQGDEVAAGGEVIRVGGDAGVEEGLGALDVAAQ
jgi:hypothetical protein